MTQIAKLYAAVVASSKITIAFREFEQLLRAFGFEEIRQRGSHRSFAHPDVPGLLVVQPLGKAAKAYQVRQFLDMIEQNDLEMSDR